MKSTGKFMCYPDPFSLFIFQMYSQPIIQYHRFRKGEDGLICTKMCTLDIKEIVKSPGNVIEGIYSTSSHLYIEYTDCVKKFSIEEIQKIGNGEIIKYLPHETISNHDPNFLRIKETDSRTYLFPNREELDSKKNELSSHLKISADSCKYNNEILSSSW